MSASKARPSADTTPEAGRSFVVESEPAVQIAVYDATRTVCGRAEGRLELRLPPGLYRVLFERAGAVEQQIVDHEAETQLRYPGPPLHSPVPFHDAATTDKDAAWVAVMASHVDMVGAPLGSPPRNGRLFVYCRRVDHANTRGGKPSERLGVYDVEGRPLNFERSVVLDGGMDVAYSCFAPAGTYRLRSERSQRELAITIPAGRAAHVFLVDTGAIRLEDARVALVPIDAPFDPGSRLWAVMECLIAALRTPGRPLPRAARELLPSAAKQDLCFGIAAAHLLLRAGEHAAFQAVLDRLEPHRELPDVTILLAADRGPSWRSPVASLYRMVRRAHAALAYRFGRGAAPGRLPQAPPLLRASLVLALTGRGFDTTTLSPTCAFAEAARRQLPDSAWCTWSTRTWDERWIAPTVDRLVAHGQPSEPPSIARRLALPASTVDQALGEIEAAQKAAIAARGLAGYDVQEVLGRGPNSTVFRAKRQSDGEEVALKIISGTQAAGRFDSGAYEPVPLAGSPGSGVIAAMDRGRLPGKAGMWIEMELCKESSLDHVADTDTPMAPRDAVRWICCALHGLAEIHRRGRIHGRIGPANLLKRQDGFIAIADLDADARSWWRIGPEAWPDLRFIAPECLFEEPRARHRRDQLKLAAGMQDSPGDMGRSVLRGCSVTGDLWAMAATLYFLLTLEPPRPEYAGQNRRHAMQHNPALPIALHHPRLSPPLATLIDRVLSSDPDERPSDADAFRLDLEALEELDLLDDAESADTSSKPWLREPRPDVRLPRAMLRVRDIGERVSSEVALWRSSDRRDAGQAQAETQVFPLDLGVGGSRQRVWMKIETTASRLTPTFALSEGGPYFPDGLSWSHLGYALFLDIQLPDGVEKIRCRRLMCSRCIDGRQQLCIPAKECEYDLEIALGRRAEMTALAVQGHDAEETHPIWAYDPLLALPAGGHPQTVHVKLVEGGDHVTAGFSLHAAGPYHVGGCSWKCGDEPLFVTFKMAEGIAEIACSELSRSEPHSGTQYMCIPPLGATYDLVVLFAPTVPLERLMADIVLKFVVVPGLGTSGGGGGGLGVGWGGSQPIPSIS